MKEWQKINHDLEAFKVSTHEIQIKPLQFKREICSNSLNALLLEPERQEYSWRTEQNISPTFFLERENSQTFKVSCQAEILLQNACVRCLEQLTHSFHIDFTLRMMEKKEGATPTLPGGEDMIFNSEALAFEGDCDYTVGYFSNRHIDLAQILREQIFLVVPDYPQCGMGLALVKNKCQTLIPLANYNDGQKDRQNPFVTLFEKANFK